MSDDYKCVMVNPPKPTTLKSRKVKVRGGFAELPSRRVFVAEHGGIFVSNGEKGKLEEFTGIGSFARAAMSTTIIENFSGSSEYLKMIGQASKAADSILQKLKSADSRKWPEPYTTVMTHRRRISPPSRPNGGPKKPKSKAQAG